MSENGSSSSLAIAGLAIGAICGGIVGYAVHAFTSEPEIVEQEKIVKEELSEDDLAALCEELTPDERTKVMSAQKRVEDLEALLSEKEALLAELKAEDEKDEARRKAAAKQWKDMEAEIEQLRAERDAAVAERDELKQELQETLVELDRQIKRAETFKAKAKHYKKKSTENGWQAFFASAKVEICDKGSRKRHERCHEAVEAALGPSVREKFTTCVDSYQATPILRQAEKGEELPAYAEWLPDDNKFTKKGWYIIFCDPTLPEGQTLDEIDQELLEE